LGRAISARANREHLLLAARQRPAELGPSAPSAGERARRRCRGRPPRSCRGGATPWWATSRFSRTVRPAKMRRPSGTCAIPRFLTTAFGRTVGERLALEADRAGLGPQQARDGCAAGWSCPRHWRPAAPPPRPGRPPAKCRAAHRSRRRATASPSIVSMPVSHVPDRLPTPSDRRGRRPGLPSAIFSPKLITAMRSATRMTSPILCSTSTRVRPLRAQSLEDAARSVRLRWN